jgi:hypothetical protein
MTSGVASVWGGLEAYEKITMMRFGEGASESESRASREGLHIRILEQDGLDLLEFAVGLRHGGARRREEIQNETALVDIGHEAAGDTGVGDRAHDQQRHHRQQEQRGPLEQSRHQPAMLPRQPTLAAAVGIMPAVEVDEAPRQDRYEKCGHQVGHHQRDRHRHRQRLRKSAGHARQETQGHENNERGQARPRERAQEFASRRQDRTAPAAFRCGPGAAGDVLDHHDDVVDDEPDGRRDAAERHDVEAHLQDAEHQNGHRQGPGHHNQRDEQDAQVAQECHQHDSRQHQADEHGVAHAGFGLQHEFALVVPFDQLHAGRQGQPAEPALHLRRDLHGVAIGLLEHVEQNRVLAVFDHARPLRHEAIAHIGHIAQVHHAVRIGFDDDRTQVLDGVTVAVGDNQIELALILHPADGLQRVAGGDLGGEIRERETV